MTFPGDLILGQRADALPAPRRSPFRVRPGRGRVQCDGKHCNRVVPTSTAVEINRRVLCPACAAKETETA